MKNFKTMGQYRFWIEFKLQIGLLFYYNKKDNSLNIQLPFLEMIIAFGKNAKGYYLFKHD